MTRVNVKVREKPKVQVRRITARTSGLCSTCVNSSGCHLNADYDRPVLFCEEYDSGAHIAPEEIGAARSRGGSLQDSAMGSTGDVGQFQGLCVNCSQLKSCVFATPGAAVLECNEYS